MSSTLFCIISSNISNCQHHKIVISFQSISTFSSRESGHKGETVACAVLMTLSGGQTVPAEQQHDTCTYRDAICNLQTAKYKSSLKAVSHTGSGLSVQRWWWWWPLVLLQLNSLNNTWGESGEWSLGVNFCCL